MIEERITHIESANGRISLDQLGATLMHEHLVMAFAGWEGDSLVPTKKKAELVSICVDKIAELQDGGFSSLLDPCPIDIGRDVELYGEVAARTGFNILFATGIYNEHFSSAYWRFKLGFASDAVEHLAEMYIREITEGLGGAKLKPAVIKLAIGLDPNSAYEEKLIQAAVIACKETNTPILTHTDGVGGDILINKLVARAFQRTELLSATAAVRRIRITIDASLRAGPTLALIVSGWRCYSPTTYESKAYINF